MKKIIVITVFSFLNFLIGFNAFAQNNATKNSQKGFALLELFTSEGCSSCPPADKLMDKLQNEYKNDKVYILAYHVDYWDRQGWKDIFSNADFTKRQYEYAKFLGKEPIYTPQVIINGKIDYIGSEENSLRNGIKTALSKTAFTNINFEVNQMGNTLSVNYTVGRIPKKSNLLLAVVQKEARSSVKRGENANRVLSHYQIVRHLYSVALIGNTKGSTLMNLPKGFNTKKYELIGFIQDMNSGTVLGAERVTLNSN